MTHYDSYGNRTVYTDTIDSKAPRTWADFSTRNKENRFLIWVYTDSRSAVGYHHTFESLPGAIRAAKVIRSCGYGVRIADRMIRRGETGFLADKSGSYYRGLDGNMHTGSFEEIQNLLHGIGYWTTPHSHVSLGTIKSGESVGIQIQEES